MESVLFEAGQRYLSSIFSSIEQSLSINSEIILCHFRLRGTLRYHLYTRELNSELYSVQYSINGLVLHI